MNARSLLVMLLVLGLCGAAQAVVYVKYDSPGPAFDGNSWQTAYHTIQQGVTDAQGSSEAVWVARGMYAEKVSVTQAIEVYGGFAGTESSLAERNWASNASIVDAGGDGDAFSLSGNARIDGFTIRNGAYGVSIDSCSPTISNNTITGCKTFGVYSYSGSPTVSGNNFTANTFGIGSELGSPVISRNVFSGNSEYAVYCLSGSPVVRGNTMQSNYGGVYSSSGTLTVDANKIQTSAACGVYACEGVSATISGNLLQGNDEGIRTDAIGPLAINNTIVSSTRYGGFWHDGAPTYANNIIAYNPTGLAKFGGTVSLSRNDVCLNGLNYGEGITPTIDISADPLFVNKDAGDFHLRTGSPCIDSGRVSGAPKTDLDGTIRPQDGNGDGTALYDMGAYEYPLNLSTAKSNLADGASITFGTASVTATFPDDGFIYVEKPDRSWGIRVNTPSAFSEGQLLNVQGTIQTDAATGERYVSPALTWPQATGSVLTLRSIAMNQASVGGGNCGLQAGVWSIFRIDDMPDSPWLLSTGLNNIGLLVTAVGTVRYVGDGCFYVDDGSKMDDGSGHFGVKVSAAGFTCPSSGLVKVTGIVSCEKLSDGKLVRLIRVRKQEDIVPL